MRARLPRRTSGGGMGERPDNLSEALRRGNADNPLQCLNGTSGNSLYHAK